MRPAGWWVLIAVAASWASGCARLVVLDPDVAHARNDAGWKVRSRPRATETMPAVAITSDGDGAAKSPTAPVVPLAAASDGGAAGAIVPLPATSTPVLVAHRSRPEIAAAMETKPDGLGIPAGLYAVDPLLTAHRKEMDSQMRARRMAGAGAIALGLVAGSLAVVNYELGKDAAASPDKDRRDTAGTSYVLAVVAAALGLGGLVTGTALMIAGPDSTPIDTYYRETYASRP